MIFVFGSNKDGIHGAGAAKFALENYHGSCGQDTNAGYDILRYAKRGLYTVVSKGEE